MRVFAEDGYDNIVYFLQVHVTTFIEQNDMTVEKELSCSGYNCTIP